MAPQIILPIAKTALGSLGGSPPHLSFPLNSYILYEREVNAEIKTVEKGKLILPDRCIMVPILIGSNILFFLIMSAEYHSITHKLSLENSLSLLAFLKGSRKWIKTSHGKYSI